MLMAMEFMVARLHAVRNSERGSAIVEYALLVTLVSVACVGAVQKLGVEVSNVFQTAADAL